MRSKEYEDPGRDRLWSLLQVVLGRFTFPFAAGSGGKGSTQAANDAGLGAKVGKVLGIAEDGVKCVQVGV